MCGRELRPREEDSTNSFICLLKKMKEMRLMEKVVEETEEVRKLKLGGCWDVAGEGLEGGRSRQGVALAVAAVSPRLRCCQAFTERMEALAEHWRDLHARRARLKAHVVTSGTTVKVPLTLLAHCPCSATASPPSASPAEPLLRQEL